VLQQASTWAAVSKASEAGRVTATNASKVTLATNLRKPHPVRIRTFKHTALHVRIQRLRRLCFMTGSCLSPETNLAESHVTLDIAILPVVLPYAL
jgi:hypothetical protein